MNAASTIEERVAVMEDRQDLNQKEHEELKTKFELIFKLIKEVGENMHALNVKIEKESARRGVLVSIGAAVVAAAGTALLAIGAPEATQWLHNWLHGGHGDSK